MVDALVSGASAARRASSSLVPGTTKEKNHQILLFFHVLAVVLALYCSREIIAVSPVDILGTTSRTPIDCSDDNIKYARAELFGFFTLCEKHPDVQKSPE